MYWVFQRSVKIYSKRNYCQLKLQLTDKYYIISYMRQKKLKKCVFNLMLKIHANNIN